MKPFTKLDKAMTLSALLLIATIFVAIPIISTYREFVYSHYGQIVDAMVTHREAGSVCGGRSGPRPVVNIDYSFRDEAGVKPG